jgi:hypothetical protein
MAAIEDEKILVRIKAAFPADSGSICLFLAINSHSTLPKLFSFYLRLTVYLNYIYHCGRKNIRANKGCFSCRPRQYLPIPTDSIFYVFTIILPLCFTVYKPSPSDN